MAIQEQAGDQYDDYQDICKSYSARSIQVSTMNLEEFIADLIERLKEFNSPLSTPETPFKVKQCRYKADFARFRK